MLAQRVQRHASPRTHSHARITTLFLHCDVSLSLVFFLFRLLQLYPVFPSSILVMYLSTYHVHTEVPHWLDESLCEVESCCQPEAYACLIPIASGHSGPPPRSTITCCISSPSAPPALVRQTACPREPPQHGPPRAEAPFVASHSPRRPLPCWPGEAAACGVRCSTAHRGTWLVGHACGCDAAAAASSPPHVRVCVCVCVQHALMLMRRRGVEGRSGDMVAACLCLSLAAFTTPPFACPSSIARTCIHGGCPR